MKIFYSFLIIISSVILILLPINQGVYNFENGTRTDHATVTTNNVTTNATVSLFKPITGNDTSTITISSNSTDEAPYMASYNGTTRALVISGLAVSEVRILSVSYDTPVITNNAMVQFLNIIPWIWVFIWVCFPIMALLALKPWQRR